MRNRSIEIAAQPKNVFALVGANLHPVSGPEIKGGTLVIAGGKIAAIGPAGTPIPPEAQTIELSGLDIWPGMVDAGSTIGLFEVGSLTETQDSADAAQFQPELRSSTALHPDSEHIPVTRANGILTSFVEPTGGTISGQGCLIDLNGWVPRELVIADPVALNVTIPTYISRTPESRRPGPGPSRPGQGPGGAAGADRSARAPQGTARQDQGALPQGARLRRRSSTKAHERGEAPPAPDPRLEALAPYARGQKPVIFHAEQQVEILDALEIIRELEAQGGDLGRLGSLEGGRCASSRPRCRSWSAARSTCPGTITIPTTAAYANPAKLHAAGVTVAIHSKGGGSSNETAARNLPFEAATAVAFGLPEEVALKAVTLTPAQILGVADQVGLARNRQARQPGRHGGTPAPADDARAGPLHRRRAAPPREPPHAALRQVPPPARRGPSRPGPAGNRTVTHQPHRRGRVRLRRAPRPRGSDRQFSAVTSAAASTVQARSGLARLDLHRASPRGGLQTACVATEPGL